MKQWLGIFLGFLFGIISCICLSMHYLSVARKNMLKFRNYFHTMVQWMRLKQNDDSVEDFFNEHQYQNIAIYGMSAIGELLLRELEQYKLNIVCYIDRRNCDSSANIHLVKPTDEIPDVDVMIITATNEYKEIVGNMRKRVDCDFVSVDDVIGSLY